MIAVMAIDRNIPHMPRSCCEVLLKHLLSYAQQQPAHGTDVQVQTKGAPMKRESALDARMGLKPGGSARLDRGDAAAAGMPVLAGRPAAGISPSSSSPASSSMSVASSLRCVPSPWPPLQRHYLSPKMCDLYESRHAGSKSISLVTFGLH